MKIQVLQIIIHFVCSISHFINTMDPRMRIQNKMQQRSTASLTTCDQNRFVHFLEHPLEGLLRE
jgi:hypothetical protein